METSYTTRAIEALNSAHEFDYGPGIRDWLVNGLRSSVKFRLPENGELIASASDVHSSLLEVYRLPFEKIAIEFDIVGLSLSDIDHENSVLPKKIVTYAHHIDDICKFTKEIGILDCSLFEKDFSGYFMHSSFMTDDGIWWPSPFAAIAEYGAHDDTPTPKGWSKVPLVAFELGGPFVVGARLTMQQMATEYVRDLTAVINVALCSLCENVDHQVIKSPKYTNTLRLKKNKEPFYEYKILKIKGKNPHGGKSKTGSGVKLHMRRGHIRKLPDGRFTWVRHAVVGDKSRGIVASEYNLK